MEKSSGLEYMGESLSICSLGLEILHMEFYPEFQRGFKKKKTKLLSNFDFTKIKETKRW